MSQLLKSEAKASSAPFGVWLQYRKRCFVFQPHYKNKMGGLLGD